MNENINLCEILKGHEGETFYSPIFGDLTFVCTIYPDVRFKTSAGDIWDINPNGKLYNNSDELCVFPSKDQRDWNKWIEEQNTKVPKTWSEIDKVFLNQDVLDAIETLESQTPIISDDISLKSALALLKIHQLIEIGYGGNVTNEEWDSKKEWFVITCYDFETSEIVLSNKRSHIAFHTREQAEEFLSHPENIQLLKDYFMINK